MRPLRLGMPVGPTTSPRAETARRTSSSIVGSGGAGWSSWAPYASVSNGVVTPTAISSTVECIDMIVWPSGRARSLGRWDRRFAAAPHPNRCAIEGSQAMTNFFVIYMALWVLACLIAAVLMVRLRSTLELFQWPYWAGLFQGWKIVSFLIAATGLVLVAPYTGDPTWDHVDALFMSLLTYATAPWVVGTFYRTIRGTKHYLHTYIAMCVWMFSASWSYDLYLVLRDGSYPITWFSNIFASSVLYFSAGLLWSLENVKGRGVIFGFMDPRWPLVPKTENFTRIVWYALPFMILATALIVSFLL